MSATSPARRRLARLLSPALLALALVLVLLEVTAWRLLGALGRVLERLSPFAALERLVARLSPGWVVAVFVLPFVPAIPLLKLLEVWLIVHHHYVAAALLIIGGKVVGAAFATRVYAVALPKMLMVGWFARGHAVAQRLLAIGHALVARTPGLAAMRQAVRQGMDAARAVLAARLAPLRHGLRTEDRGTPLRLMAARRRARRARQQ